METKQAEQKVKNVLTFVFKKHLKSEFFNIVDKYPTFVGVDDGCNFKGVIVTLDKDNIKNSIIRYGADFVNEEDWETSSNYTTLLDLVWIILDMETK